MLFRSDSGYDMSKVEQSTVMVFSDMHVIPVVRAQLSTDSMELFFSRVPTETMLGHGTHVIYVTGAFSDGWVHFCGEGQLQVIDPEVVALELAQDMMIDLESTQDLTQAKIDLCREAIGQGKEGPEKDNLFSRLETVQQAFSLAEISFEFAQEMMTSLETDVELTQQKIDLCREAIGQVTDGLEKDSLTTKLKLVQERFSAEQASLLEAQYDEAEVALVNAEASNLQADYDIAAALINALPVGEESSELLAGLEAISVIIPEPAVDDNAAGDAGDEGSTDGDGDYNPTSDIGDEGSTNDADADADADDEDEIGRASCRVSV